MNYWRFKMLYRIAERRPRARVSVVEALAAVCGLMGRAWAAVSRSVTAAFRTPPGER